MGSTEEEPGQPGELGTAPPADSDNQPIAQGGTPAEAPAERKQSPTWRRWLTMVLLVLACIMLPLAVTGVWVRANIFSTDGYVETVAPLAADPAVQQATATALADQVFTRLDLEQRLGGVLPRGLGFLAGPVVDGLEDRARIRAEQLVSSQGFQTVWNSANRLAHETLVRFLRGDTAVQLGPDGTIALDLSQVSARLVDQLRQAGLPITQSMVPSAAQVQVPIAQASALNDVKGLLTVLNRLFIILPIVTLLFLAASVVLSTDRWRTLRRMGIGFAIAMAVMMIALVVGRSIYLSHADDANVSRDLSVAFWSTLTVALRATVIGLFCLGILMLIVAVLHHYSVTARLAGQAAGRGWNLGPLGRWVQRHRTWLSVAILVIGFIVLAAWSGITIWTVLIVSLIVVVLVALIQFVAIESSLSTQTVTTIEPPAGERPNPEGPEQNPPGGT